jgi:hypothetical protein
MKHSQALTRTEVGLDEHGIPWPIRCALYSPGHNVHWMPGLRVANDRAEEPSWEGRVTLQEGVWLTVEAQYGSTRRYAHHDPERLRAALVRSHGWVLVNDRYKLLRAEGYAFGVTLNELDACQEC